MEGEKSFAAEPQDNEKIEQAELLAESIERAQEVYSELSDFNGVEVLGADAMDLNARAEELASELKSLLKNIPAAECMANGLPYHPTDEKIDSVVTPFPAKPDYPLSYEPQSSGVDYSQFGTPHKAAA